MSVPAGLRVTFLGTGTSTGVPSVTCDCRVCTSDDPRDERLRPSVLLEWDGASVLVSTATSMSLGGNFFQAGDVVEWDGTTSSARYSRTELGNPNVDALFLFDEDLMSETLLFSSSGNFTLDGTPFTPDQLARKVREVLA